MGRREVVVHGVQLFIEDKGKLTQGGFVECKSPEEASCLAAERVRQGRAAGAAAFMRRVYDREFDDGSGAVTLATFGRVPRGVADQVPF